MMSPGSQARVARLLSRAGLALMWGELKSGAWGTSFDTERLFVISNAEDPDLVPDPRDVVLCTYVRAESGEWGDGYEEYPTTLRDALKWLDSMKATRQGANQ